MNINHSKNDKVLFILERGPESISPDEIKTALSKYLLNGNSITLFIQKAGVRWLLDRNWANIYPGHESIVYYVDAGDMHFYDVPFQEDVIISSSKIIRQLLTWADQVYFLS